MLLDAPARRRAARRCSVRRRYSIVDVGGRRAAGASACGRMSRRVARHDGQRDVGGSAVAKMWRRAGKCEHSASAAMPCWATMLPRCYATLIRFTPPLRRRLHFHTMPPFFAFLFAMPDYFDLLFRLFTFTRHDTDVFFYIDDATRRA